VGIPTAFFPVMQDKKERAKKESGILLKIEGEKTEFKLRDRIMPGSLKLLILAAGDLKKSQRLRL
jgi:hypothetical protein